tara:strand:+ start:19489 stop:20661 length:1173 start_codon:yes stop_codon:yes gene_type:complete
MIQKMLLSDSTVKIWNIQFVGAHDARGLFYSKNTPIPISEGILLSTGNAVSAQGPNKGVGFTTSHFTKGDKDLHFLAKFKTYDATYISFDFQPTQDIIRFNYVFASEEYPEYVGSSFNDVFGFFLTDLTTGEITNLAVIPNTNFPITVNNINHKTRENFYIENSKGKDALIEFDGLTKKLIAYSIVKPGNKYRIKIAIADVADDAFDSGVFLEGKSLRSENKKDFFDHNQDYFEAFSTASLEPVVDQITPEKIAPLDKEKPSIEVPEVKEQIKNTTPKTNKLDSITIYFDFDKKVPTPFELKRLTAELNNLNLANYTMQVKGHTDQKGTDKYNQNLSENRAEYIANWLFKNYQIKPKTTQGFSYHRLANPKNDPHSRSKNRRVTIYLHSK